ncbi:MAG: hypothetical protein K6G80_11110 [Treponema sp.]|nr:hypothetical protein [Treponema sp.]
MKLTGTFIVPLAAFLSLAMLTACSNDTVDVTSLVEKAVTENAEGAVSLEDTTLYGDLMNARFVGAHTAYITMYDSNISEEENIYTYSATSNTLTFTLRKIAAPDGSGLMLTQDEYISWWSSDGFRLSSIITEDVTSWYRTETFTVTATDDTIYTFTNKTSYTVSAGETSAVTTTSGKSTSSDSTETTLFSDVTGCTEIESEYSASEFTNVVTVNAPYTGYPLELVGATVGESVSAIGSDDEDTQEAIKEREAVFELRYAALSANDWALVQAAFSPYSFSYEKNKTVTESSISGDESYEYQDVTYDYYLTQQYTVPETAVFIYGDDDTATEKTIAAFTGLRGLVSTVSDGETQAMYETINAETTAETLTFAPVSEAYDAESDTETISASYSLHEKGDKATLTLSFETKDGFTVSGKTITLEFSPITSGLMIID